MSIEQTLSQLADNQLITNVPSVQQDVVAFQLVDADEDNNEASGIIFATVGEYCVMFPAVYRKGKMYPMDLMYLPEIDRFFPAKDAWISYLRSNQPDIFQLAKPKSNSKNKPSAVALKLPFSRMMSKQSSVLGGDYVGASMEMSRAVIQKWADSVADMDMNAPVIPGGLPGMLTKVSSDAAITFMDDVIKHPTVANAVYRFYSPEDMLQVAEVLDKKSKNKPVTTEDKKSVKVVTIDDKDAVSLNDEQKTLLLKDGVCVVDERGIKPSKVYYGEYNGTWTIPNSPGVYNLLALDGESIPAIVLMKDGHFGDDNCGSMCCESSPDNGQLFRDQPSERLIIPLTGEGKECFSSTSAVGAHVGDSSIEEFGYKLENMPDIVSKYTKEDYDDVSMIATDGKTYCQFRLTSPRRGRPTLKLGSTATYGPVSEYGDVKTIVLMKDAPKMKMIGKSLVVNEGVRFFVLSGKCPEESALAGAAEAMDSVVHCEGAIRLKINNINDSYSVSTDEETSEPMNKVACMHALVESFGVDPFDARDMVIANTSGRSDRYLIKLAANDDFGLGMGMAQVPARVKTEETLVLNPMSSEERSQLDNAANSGMQDVLDVTILKTLSGRSQSLDSVSEYLPNLMTAMDNIGRLIYLFRAGDSLLQAYGIGQSEALERQLKNLFEDMGEVILYLQQGKVKPTSDLLSGDLTGGNG